MIRKKVTIQDYERISQEHEYYLWHFVNKGGGKLNKTIFSVFDDYDLRRQHRLKEFLEMCDIPYFESYIEDSLNFVDNIVPLNSLWASKRGEFNTLIMGFNRRRMITSTFHTCLCIEGITEVILKLNPKFIENINLD
jgi:hypothetical protein